MRQPVALFTLITMTVLAFAAAIGFGIAAAVQPSHEVERIAALGYVSELAATLSIVALVGSVVLFGVREYVSTSR